MKHYSTFLCCLFLLVFAFSVNVNATVIISNGFPYYGNSWDNPSDELEAVLQHLQADIFGDGTGDIHLNLINYPEGDAVETWYGMGADSIILEEIAGYADSTTFGYYSDISGSGTIFYGWESTGATDSVSFDNLTNFGFYIDPNGITGDRMYTEHNSNTHDDYQVAIFEIIVILCHVELVS